MVINIGLLLGTFLRARAGGEGSGVAVQVWFNPPWVLLCRFIHCFFAFLSPPELSCFRKCGPDCLPFVKVLRSNK